MCRTRGFYFEMRHAMIFRCLQIEELPRDVASHLLRHLRRSLSWDQGAEMARHAELTVAADLPVYFCDPHSRCCHVNLSAIGEGIALVGSGDVRSRFPDIKCLQPMEADG
jgi:hypothetical protein